MSQMCDTIRRIPLTPYPTKPEAFFGKVNIYLFIIYFYPLVVTYHRMRYTILRFSQWKGDFDIEVHVEVISCLEKAMNFAGILLNKIKQSFV